MLANVLEILASDETIVVLATVVAIAIGLIVKVERTKRIIGTVAGLAFDTVNALKDRTATKIDDKAAIALGVIAEHLGRDLMPTEVKVAKATFDARHDQELAARAIAARLARKGPNL